MLYSFCSTVKYLGKIIAGSANVEQLLKISRFDMARNPFILVSKKL